MFNWIKKALRTRSKGPTPMTGVVTPPGRTEMFCARCGYRNVRNHDNCRHCGKPLHL